MAHGFVTFHEVDQARKAIRDLGGDLAELLTGN
ncbi:RNA-binding protein [Halalkalicoccus tibetensis]|uniref:RNA recognition motif domain-containing protein n=1 Tax=Halalkalicoccus tibetensis TaxID=175632 RepID=A0ABD5V9Y3_9EURY